MGWILDEVRGEHRNAADTAWVVAPSAFELEALQTRDVRGAFYIVDDDSGDPINVGDMALQYYQESSGTWIEAWGESRNMQPGYSVFPAVFTPDYVEVEYKPLLSQVGLVVRLRFRLLWAPFGGGPPGLHYSPEILVTVLDVPVITPTAPPPDFKALVGADTTRALGPPASVKAMVGAPLSPRTGEKVLHAREPDEEMAPQQARPRTSPAQTSAVVVDDTRVVRPAVDSRTGRVVGHAMTCRTGERTLHAVEPKREK